MMHRLRYIVLCLLAVTALTSVQAKEASNGLKFFYRVGKWVDKFCLQGLDTNYITLPEHSWRVSFNTGSVGIHSDYASYSEEIDAYFLLHLRTTPSMELGFNAGFRGFGFGYSWDVLNAYASNMNFSLGGKSIGLEFMRHVSTNLKGTVSLSNFPEIPAPIDQGYFWITNINLSAWYALNSKHYSHNAAIKQSYIQKKTAGSLLVSLSYMNTDLSMHDTTVYDGVPGISLFLDQVTHVVTHQVSVGLGYGINYTPNHGKVLIHAAAFAQLVCYSINQVSFAVADSIQLPGKPYYNIKPQTPVHVTGTVRAAVSWEINEWVHLSAWGQFNNIRFTSHEREVTRLMMSNWNWQAHLTVGVRFGAGKKRVHDALADDPLPEKMTIELPKPRKPTPQWITDYFYSSHFGQ